jgi:hypothetical protein
MSRAGRGSSAQLVAWGMLFDVTNARPGARENLVGMVGEQAVDVSPLPEGTPYTLI